MKKMRISKKLTALVLSVMLLLASFPLGVSAATSDKTTADGLVYTVTNGTVTIKQYKGTATEVVVPETIDGMPVTAIGDGAFAYKADLQKVTLPDSITRIQIMAFMGCEALTSINLSTLPALEKIGAYAFAATALAGTLRLPASLTTICSNAFSYTDLVSLHLGKNVQPPARDSGNPWGVALTNSGMNTTILGMNIANMTLEYSPDYPKETSAEALTKNIAMSCPKLQSITVDAQNPYYRSVGGVLYSKDMTKLYCYPSGKTAKTFFMPSTVTDFYNAFGGIHFEPIKIKLLGDYDVMDSELTGFIDFGATGNLENVVLSPSVTRIIKAAFYNTSLKNIFIPKTITSIGEKAFWHCRNLTTVGFDRDSVYKQLPEQCFKDCTSLKNITFGRVDYLSKLAFDYCTSIESVDLTNVLALDETAFDNCTSLAEVVYGDSDAAEKATVSNAAFEDTPSLETVMLGSAVKSVEAKAFANCTNLKTAYISDEVESISPTAFDGCENLTITVPTETCYAYEYAVKNSIPVTTLQISPIPNQTYTGTAIEPEITVMQSGRQLKENTDYEVLFKNNTDFGTASVTVVGKGAYSVFAAVAKFAILQRDLDDGVLISNILPQSASETGKEPEIALSCGHYILQKDIDYTVEYANNTQVGTASVTVTGIGNFTGTKTLTFEITDVPPTEIVEYMPGDIDGNGEIALTDYALMRNIAIGMMTVTDEAVLKAGDLNGDTVVDFFDVSLMNLKLNGWDI